MPVYLFSNQAAQFLTQYLFPNYAGYIGSRYWEGLGYRYAIFPILYFAAVWLLRKRLLQRDEGDRILINSAFYVMLLYIFCTHHMILERFSIYLVSLRDGAAAKAGSQLSARGGDKSNAAP